MGDFVHVVSFSGGRTSAYLVYLMEQRRIKEGLNVKYIFMDTGAEHPKTYEFIRNIVKHWGIDLVCVRTKFNPILGKANSYEVIDVNDLKPDLKPWVEMLKKYSTPYNPSGAFCTDRMKVVPHDKYCNEHYGRKNYIGWLGIRVDEPARLKRKLPFHYLAEISDFDKADILNWWKQQPFDLGIPEHLGNCVFCIKKGANRIALAMRDEPEMLAEFMGVINADTVRQGARDLASELMYRNYMSLEKIQDVYIDYSTDEIKATIRPTKGVTCAESCDIDGAQLNMFPNEDD